MKLEQGVNGAMRHRAAQHIMLAAIMTFTPLILGSCATHRDSTAMREEMNAFNVHLLAMEQHNALVDSLLEEQRQLTLNQRASLTQQIMNQNEQLTMIGARQDEINVLLHDVLSQLEAIQLYGGARPSGAGVPNTSRPDTVSAAPANIPSGPTVKPEDLYKAATDDIANGGYALAESRLLTFLIQFPDHKLAESAQFQLGEAEFGQNKFDVSVKEFDTFVKKYPKSAQIPAALLRKGQSQQQSGDSKSAQQTWQQLIKTYPKSNESAQAKDLISAAQGQ